MHAQRALQHGYIKSHNRYSFCCIQPYPDVKGLNPIPILFDAHLSLSSQGLEFGVYKGQPLFIELTACIQG